MTQEKPLEQIRVLVTRPISQSKALCDDFMALGAQVMSLPAIEIRAVDQLLGKESTMSTQVEWINRLTDLDFAIFISPNAVKFGTSLIFAQRNIPDKLKLVTIGKASADKLFQCTGRSPDIFPSDEFSSEALLALKPLQKESINGKNILIIRGNGGREYLADELKQRGARVEYAEVYQRCLPQVDEKSLAKIWCSEPPQIVTITSAEGLKNLLQLAGNRYQGLLCNTPLVVVSQSMISFARELGFSNDIIVANKASNKALVNGVIQWQTASEQSKFCSKAQRY
jgi:uroporphyrinogen-III synthase